jgi:hypothetical protein
MITFDKPVIGYSTSRLRVCQSMIDAADFGKQVLVNAVKACEEA